MSGKKKTGQAAPAAPSFTVAAPPAYEKPKRAQKPKQDAESDRSQVLDLKSNTIFPIWGGVKLRQAQNMKDDGTAITMWQPWASLLVWGIKRFEGRVWNSDFRGRLWIHSATHSLEESEIKAMEEEYADLGLPFPKSYPQSALLGCVDVVDMVAQDDLKRYREEFEKLPADQRDATDDYMFKDNSPSDYAFVCVNPKRLPVPLAMTGKLPKAVHEAAKQQLELK